jgi:hypothetical protein
MAKEYTGLRVSKAAKQDAEQAKKENETWDDYIRRCAENPPEVKEFVELKDELSMAAEPTVDEGEIIDRVCKRIDDLQSQLPAQIREELHER